MIRITQKFCFSCLCPIWLFYSVQRKYIALPNIVLWHSFVSQRKHSGHFLDLWGTTISYRGCLKIMTGICLTKSKKWHFEGPTLLKGTFIFPKAPQAIVVLSISNQLTVGASFKGALLSFFFFFLNWPFNLGYFSNSVLLKHFDMSQKWHIELTEYDLGAHIVTIKYATNFLKLLI